MHRSVSKMDIHSSTSEHECQLLVTRRSTLKKEVLSMGFWNAFWHRLRNYLTLSEELPICTTHFKSSRAMDIEKKRHLLVDYSIIHPFSDFRVVWEEIMIFMIAAQLIVAPFVMTFLPREMYSLTNNPTMGLVLVADILSLVDIGLTFKTGVYIQKEREIILNGRDIMMKYLKSRFILDALSSLPLELFLYLPEPQGNLGDFLATPFVLLTLCKVFHAVTLFTYIKRFWVNRNKMSHARKLALQALGFAIFAHWFACFRFLFFRFFYGDMEDSVPKETFVRQFKFLSKNPLGRYIQCLFNVTSPCLCYRFAYYRTFDLENAMITSLLFLFGFLLRILVTTQILILTRNTNATKMKYQNMMQQLKEFIRYKRLGLAMSGRLLDYYMFRFQRNYYKEESLLAKLSAQLRQEIISCNCRRLVANVYFFHNIPQSLLINIVTNLHMEIYLPKDVVTLFGQPGNCMFFIASGSVAVYSEQGEERAHLNDGAHFGEMVLVNESCLRSATVVAIETCELFILNRADFLKAMRPYPELLERMREAADLRVHSARAAFKRWISYRKNKSKRVSLGRF